MSYIPILVDGPVSLEECQAIDRVYNPVQSQTIKLLRIQDMPQLDKDYNQVIILLRRVPADGGAFVQQLYTLGPPSCKLSVLLASVDATQVNQLLQSMKVAGLTDAIKTPTPPIVAHALFKQFSVLVGTKPAFQQGAKAKLSLAKSNKNSTAAPKAQTAERMGAWKLTSAAADDLYDDDELLDDNFDPPVAARACGDGAVKPRKVCKDCTCGAAEGKIKPLTKSMIENPQSNCGSCGLGDAFRCASCPYRGLPSFEMGKKIQLPNNFLVDDLTG